MDHIRNLRIANFVLAAPTAALGLGSGTMFVTSGLEVWRGGDRVGLVLVLAGVLLSLLGASLGILHAVSGSLVGRGRGRTLQTVLAILQFGTPPVGTLYGIYALWVCWIDDASRTRFESVPNAAAGSRPHRSPSKRPDGVRVVLLILAIFGACTAFGGAAAGCIIVEGIRGLVAPPEVLEALRGSKKDYVGSWKSSHGSSLEIDSAGRIHLAKDEGDGSKETINAAIVGFDRDDILIKPVVTVRVEVTQPPHRRPESSWTMTMRGVVFERD